MIFILNVCRIHLSIHLSTTVFTLFDQAKTWCFVSSSSGVRHTISRLQSTKFYKSYWPFITENQGLSSQITPSIDLIRSSWILVGIRLMRWASAYCFEVKANQSVERLCSFEIKPLQTVKIWSWAISVSLSPINFTWYFALANVYKFEVLKCWSYSTAITN